MSATEFCTVNEETLGSVKGLKYTLYLFLTSKYKSRFSQTYKSKNWLSETHPVSEISRKQLKLEFPFLFQIFISQ